MSLERLLDIIFQLESSSGTNPRAYKENKYGALGGYGVLRSTYDAMSKSPLSAFRGIPFETAMADDNYAREIASNHLLNQMKEFKAYDFEPTDIDRGTAYHSGTKNVSRGTLGPLGRDYKRKVTKHLGGPNG